MVAVADWQYSRLYSAIRTTVVAYRATVVTSLGRDIAHSLSLRLSTFLLKMVLLHDGVFYNGQLHHKKLLHISAHYSTNLNAVVKFLKSILHKSVIYETAPSSPPLCLRIQNKEMFRFATQTLQGP